MGWRRLGPEFVWWLSAGKLVVELYGQADFGGQLTFLLVLGVGLDEAGPVALVKHLRAP